jgi:hypothetical protein
MVHGSSSDGIDRSIHQGVPMKSGNKSPETSSSRKPAQDTKPTPQPKASSNGAADSKRSSQGGEQKTTGSKSSK